MKKFIFYFIFSVLLSAFSFSQQTFKIKTQYLPRIMNLTSQGDVLMKQLCSVIEENDKKITEDSELEFEFYSYLVKKTDTIFQIAAATGIPYDTIATLNRIPDAASSIKGQIIIIPSVKGIFAAEKPETQVEVLLSKENFNTDNSDSEKVIVETDGNSFVFQRDKRFSPSQRAFFLDSGLRLPVDNKVISSSFGLRLSPVYGTWKMHNGVDFALSEGSFVYAVKSGTVQNVFENDPVFGNYLIIRHDNGMTSVYAHLQKILVKQNENVNKSQIIALSGKTGKVTGPHLHFEIRQNGQAGDPEKILHLKN